MRLHLLDPRNPWDFQEVYGRLHEFAGTYPFQPESERYLMHITTGTHVVQICMFLLTEARYFPASLLQSSPGRRPNEVAVGSCSIIDLDLSRYDQIAARFARERQESTEALKSGIPTRNAAFNRMIDAIERAAVRSRAPLLLIGPTGAGKSQLAARIYELKHQGRFREDLLAPVNLWTFRLPALRERPEDIEPNIDYELERHARLTSTTVRFNAEARAAYVRFATSADAEWAGNFRELSASVSRMATHR